MNISKSSAIDILRKEVGFGCPICRSPFLTWHHFDPPYHIEQHWRPEGMIALCPTCHADADYKGNKPGAYSNEELRKLKKSGTRADQIEAFFPAWQDKEQLLIRIGGVYTDPIQPIISINNKSFLGISKTEDGLLNLSFELCDENDNTIIKMDKNWFLVFPQSIHNMTIAPKTKDIKIWLKDKNIGLDFSFKRIDKIELESYLLNDKKAADIVFAKEYSHYLESLPPEVRQMMSQIIPINTNTSGLPEELQKAALSEDKVGAFVKSWANKNCLSSDGLIPFININKMILFYHGQRIAVGDGIANSMHYNAVFNNSQGAIEIKCACSKCLRRI